MVEPRDSFLSYFDRKGHLICAGVPLVPEGDPSLLFTSAGMVPFKPYFLGLKKGLSRVTSCQKCFRTTDIDRVGATLRHLTFFEMLGNFSFGDYFKEDAISFCWDFLTRVAGLDPKRLHPTVFLEDEEAEALWRKQATPNPVVRLGAETNFWAMGPTGPCGPCSEVYYDLGPDRGCGKASCAAGCDCDRYLEIWNLVFMQYERIEGGSLTPLPFKNIDTGMGLERLSMLVEGKESPFETSLFEPILRRCMDLLPSGPEGPEALSARRIVADHVRGAVMLACEGLIPSNVERGYVLRRLIRRASRYGRLLGAREPFLHALSSAVFDLYARPYPELKNGRTQVEQTLKAEEERFLETLEKGERELSELLAPGPKVLSGAQAFKLHDTFGFPLELTREIAGRRGVSVDEEGFAKAQAAAAVTARAGWKGSGETATARYDAVLAAHPGMRTEFQGYSKTRLATRISLLLRPGQAPGAEEGELRPGDEGEVVLAKTPFYPEGGGQVGDRGFILDDVNEGKVLAEVLDTYRPRPDLIVHRVMAKVTLRAGMSVMAAVDAQRRRTTAFHHTATHLLNEALRRVLGPSVRQAGSLVAPERLRFDFTWAKPLTPEQTAEVERIANEAIAADLPVSPQERPAEEAKTLKPITLLGENYGAKPRFLLIGAKGWDDPMDRFSLELCGGTHVSRTGEIKCLRIVKESAVAAGIRRIEAVAGPALEQLAKAEDCDLRQQLKDAIQRYIIITSKIQSVSGLPYRNVVRNIPDANTGPLEEVRKALGVMKELEKIIKAELDEAKKAKLAQEAKVGQVVLQVGTVRLTAQKFSQAELQTLRSLSDQMRRESGGVVFLGSAENNRLSFVISVTQDLIGKGIDASRIAHEVAVLQKGKAGGRPDFAQGGGPDTDWQELLDKVKDVLRSSQG